MSQPSKILLALEALKALDRKSAVTLLQTAVEEGPPYGDQWRSAAILANHVSEIEIAIECARRFSETPPRTLDRALFYYG